MAAAGAVGFARGVSQGLASARQRRLEEEDRRIAAEDRTRRRASEDVALEADRLTLERARRADVREPEDIEYQRKLREQQLATGEVGLESGRLGLAGARRTEAEAATELARRREREDVGLQADRFSLQRERATAGQEDADRRLAQEQETASNMAGLFYGLSKGMDPEMLRDRFNSLSPKKLDEITYDPETGIVSLTDQDGEQREGPLEQFMQVYPIPADKLEQLGEKERLVNPRTGEVVVDAAAAAAGDGRDVSPYNPETVGNQLRGDIVRSAGGQLGPLGEIMGIADPEARKLVDFQVAQATAMEGRLRPHVTAGRIGTGQISAAVVEATKSIPSEAELAQRAEEWRTDGFNKSQQEAADWMATERAKAQAEATRALLEAEQKLLGASARPSFTEKPAWAGEAVMGVDPSQLEPGYEYDVDIDGKTMTIRLGPDGKVYQVGSSPQASNTTGKGASRATPNRMAGNDPAAAQVNATLADARSNSRQFVY
jgi:hypothetical protein